MAAKKRTNDTATATDIPDGFDIRANRVMGDGWMKKAEGATVIGRLLGRVQNGEDDKGEPKYFFQVKIDERSPEVGATTGSGDETEDITLSLGQIVNVDASAALSELHNYSQNGGVYDVYIKFGAKEKAKKGTFWPAIVRLSMVKAPPKAPF